VNQTRARGGNPAVTGTRNAEKVSNREQKCREDEQQLRRWVTGDISEEKVSNKEHKFREGK
jgi:hypothetical protein